MTDQAANPNPQQPAKQLTPAQQALADAQAALAAAQAAVDEAKAAERA